VASGFELARVDLHRHGERRERPDARDFCQALADRVGLVLRGQALIDLRQLRVELRDAPTQLGQRLLCGLRHVGIRELPQQRLDLGNAFGRDDAELRRVTTHSVHQLRPLSHQQVTGTQVHRLGLGLDRLHRHKAHGGARCRLADRLRVVAVVLAALV
jgi:hypothetical protein